MKAYPLPVPLTDLLQGSKVESDRLEFKEGWNPAAVLRTVCAFANDFHNYGGGYIILGVGEQDGRPILPPVGIPAGQLNRIQQQLLQHTHLIHPHYTPILAIEEVEGASVLVIWCPGGEDRPYRVPKDITAKEKDYAYYIRRYASTVMAKNGDLKELRDLSPAVPFDDRLCHAADLDDLNVSLIRAYLRAVGSRLYRSAAHIPFADLCRQMAIIGGPAEAPRPRYVGLLFFSLEPERFIPTARIEVVHFPRGVTGPIEEHTFNGPLDNQLREALRHLQSSVITERVTKLPDRAEAIRVFNYPFAAVEEALVNAAYHRSYELREPIEVQVLPDQIMVLSYPGPDRSVALADLQKERIVSRRYRNRRIGDFLKELDLTEGRSTGIPKMREAMAQNGSPMPRLLTDEERTYFRIELPIHPAFLKDIVEDAVEDAVEDVVTLVAGLNDTERRILRQLDRTPLSKADLISKLGYRKITGHVRKALDRLDQLGLIALTIPDKPQSKSQKRRLTDRGKIALTSLDAQETVQ